MLLTSLSYEMAAFVLSVVVCFGLMPFVFKRSLPARKELARLQQDAAKITLSDPNLTPNKGN